MSSPQVVVDRYNPFHLASVWVRNDPDLAPGNTTLVQGAYSINGGVTWTSFNVTPGPLVDPAVAPPANAPLVRYTQTTNPLVAFDNNHQLYVLTQQSNAGNTSGALILTKFDFSGATPVQTIFGNLVHQYVQDPVFNPTLTVDDNQATFQDPVTNSVQTDPYAGNVWVGWSTSEAAPTGVFLNNGSVWNPNSIQVVGSSDGGQTFSGDVLVGTSGPSFTGVGRYTSSGGTFANATPKIAVAQGKAGGPAGGQATVIWDNFRIANATFDQIQSSVLSGATAIQVAGTGGAINQNPGSIPIGVPTDFTTAVSIANPNFNRLSKLTVSMTIQQGDVAPLAAILTAPDGRRVLLFSNAMDAGGTTPAGQIRGITGANLGIVGTSGTPAVPYGLLGVTFNTDSARSINDRGIPAGHVGTFRPEQSDLPASGYVDLSAFNGLTAAQLNGTWTLTIVDFRDNGATNPAPQLLSWGLNLTSGMDVSPVVTVATTNVRGSQSGTYARASAAAGPQGIGPGIQIAQDNTLGSFSVNQGRIYVTYVGYTNYTASGYTNPADNTDVYLVTSDDGGSTWTTRGVVNDDQGSIDGYSGANHNFFDGQIAGRAQFLPKVAVDQTTGSVVLSWRDGRDDSARARSSVYVASSIDGGQSFSSQVYANPSQTSIDAVTGNQVVIGPKGDNFSVVNQPTPTLGFGSQMGLAVGFGQIYTAWAGNSNVGYLDDAYVVHGRPFQTLVQRLTVAAGPRVVDSTMGVVGLVGDMVNPWRAPDGGPLANAFEVTFDRPIDPQAVIAASLASFTTADVRVFYHDTVNGSAFIPLKILSVSPITASAVGNFGYTRFRVVFDPTTKPNNTPTGLVNNFAGTYSYIIEPTISDQVRTVTAGGTKSGNLVDQNADGVAGQDPLTTPYVGLTPGDAYVGPMPAPKAVTTFGPDPLSLLMPPFDSKTLPLIVPGPHVVSTSTPGGTGPDNLVLNGATSSLQVNFDRNMNASSFTAADVLQIMGPAGSIMGPQYFNSNLTNQAIPAPPNANTPSTLLSKLTIPSYGGTFTAAKVSLQLNIGFPATSGLRANLIGPDGTTLTLFAQVGGNGSNFTNTIFDDSAPLSITAGAPPFSGSYKPSGAGGLAVFNGKSIEGDWTLQLINTRGGTVGTLNSWSLSVTPVISVTPVNPVGGVTKTFSVNFPMQSLSGTYTVQLGPNIFDTNVNAQNPNGQPLDTNLNAGLDVLRGRANNVPTTTVSYSSGSVNQSLVGGQIASTINVPENFLIQGLTASGRSGLRLQLNLSTPNVAPLTATLVYHPNTPNAPSVVLFSGLANGPGTGGFSNTIFDDNASTSISQSAPPFFAGPYAPKNPLLATPGAPDYSGFLGLLSGGTWQLVIQGDAGAVATLNSWSLVFEKPLPTSGLGEPVADMASSSLRIFQMDPTNPLSRNEWTAVGPAPLFGSAGRIGAMTQDPSDPTGNTFYIGGASGGIWKTTNFLTTDPQGPTYVPLTDFGPSNGMNIGGITVFARNNDPNQSIVIASTGEGDSGSPGVGFLISKDGGSTWNLYDSTTNVDAGGNLLPYNSPLRDRNFVGSTSFKVIVDPKATLQGQVIIYAAISGRNGGIWRSLDTGAHWQLMRAGNATDVVFDPSSNTGGDGNLQVVIAAFQGEGVYFSPNRGQVWNLLAGGVGNPLIVDLFDDSNVAVANGGSPNGAHGRIVLAKPALTGSPVQNQIYAGWLYAAVSNTDGSLFGIFMTKDFGQNWVKVRIPTEPRVGGFTPAIPSNDIGLADYNVTNGAGNFDITMAIDPTNPNIIYVGGFNAPSTATGMIRVDTTKIWDAHNLTLFSAAAAGGAIDLSSAGPVTIGAFQNGWFTPGDYLNFIRNPDDPFNANATLFVSNLTQFTNNGFGTEWIPFDAPMPSQGTSPSYQRLVTMVDPMTGLTRIVFGTNRGVWSVLDDNGVQLNGSSVGTTPTPGGNRNGNLQIAQFFYGAAQPSNAAVAASYDQAMFYASGNDGGPSSNGLVLLDGELYWFGTGEGSTAGGVATDQQGKGTRFQAFVPGSMPLNLGTTFFRVNHVGRTFGLFQQSGGSTTPDPQWGGNVGATFALNPLSGDQMIISSNTGRIFATENQGGTWYEIGNPSVFGSPGNFSQALAYGAPDPGAPAGVGNLGNFMYVGTSTGQIFVTRTAGGGDGSNWFNISLGLDGSTVKQIIPSPTRGTHAAFAVTTTGVYFIKDSIALAQNPGVAALGWVNVTGNLRDLSYTIFGQSYNQNADPDPIKLSQSLSLATIAVDWRYSIPNAANDPVGAGLHPVLYVGGDTGVFRSLDNGLTWTIFPDQSIDGSLMQGGYLPRVSVRDLDLSLGNINSTTGMPDLAGPYDPNNDPSLPPPTPDPNLLLATTYGRGQFAIKTSPLVLPGTVNLNPADVSGVAPDGTPLVKTSQFRVQGLSMATGFNNATRITIFDVTDNKIIGGFDPSKLAATNIAANWTDGFGNFTVKVAAGAIPTNGLKIIKIYATDDSGAIGNSITLTITLDASDLGNSLVPADPSLGLFGPDNTGLVPSQNYTSKPTPRFVGSTTAGSTVELLYRNGNGDFVPFSTPVVTTADALGNFVLTFPNLGVQGSYAVAAKASNEVGPALNLSPTVIFTIKTTGPTAPPTLRLDPYYDSGIAGDNITNVRRPVFTGNIGAVNAGSIIRVYAAAANGSPTGPILAQTIADSQGKFSVQLPLSLANGVIPLVATAVDPAGNTPPAPGYSAVLNVSIMSTALDYSGNPIDYFSGLNQPLPPAPVYSQSQSMLYFRNTSTGFGQWFTQYTPPSYVPAWMPNGITIGSTNDIPVTGDFDGDGKADLATFSRSTATWVVFRSSQGGSVFQLGTPNASLPIVGNFDGPGATQYGVFEVVNGIGVWTLTSATTGNRQYGFGTTGDVPLVGDFDGIGRDQMAVYRPSTGQFLVFVPAAGNQPASIRVVATMAPNQIPVPGRYDDLYFFNNHQAYRTEAAVFDPKTGIFTIARVAGSYFPNQAVFAPGDVPVQADYAGVGWTQPAVYRPSTGQFLIKMDQMTSNGANAQISSFSGAAGVPIVPVGAPLAYRLPGTASLVIDAAPQIPPASPPPTPTPTPVAPTPPPVVTPVTPPAPAAPVVVVVAPSLSYVTTNAPGTARPWFAGTAAPGTVIDLILSGAGVIGSKRVGTATADANGDYQFQLPSGSRNGNYTLVAQARGVNGSSTPIASASFKVGPTVKSPIKPPARVNLARSKATVPAARPSAPVRQILVAQQAAVAPLTDDVFGQAIRSMTQNRLNLRKKG